MLSPGTTEYRRALHLKRTGKPLNPPFRELAQWVQSTFDVTVIDAAYEVVCVPHRPSFPRLVVVVETNAEWWKIDEEQGSMAGEKARSIIGAKFAELLAQHEIRDVQTDGLLVCLESFEQAVRDDVHQRITHADLELLREKLDNPALWRIALGIDWFTFFFYTTAQARDHEARGFLVSYADACRNLVAPFDEFGYIANGLVRMNFDSKERLDAEYDGNTSCYYR